MRKDIYAFVSVLLITLCTVNLGISQVIAEFTATATSACAPQLIEFTDQSTGNIDSWAWTLGTPDGPCGSGPNSSLQDPGRIFTAPGVYCICLTVTDLAGNTDTECKADYITIFAPPVADVIANQVTGCPPFTVNFSDNSTVGSAAIVNWQWDLNNGNCQNASGPNVSCTYDNPGTYDISLIVTDANNCQSFITIPDMITVVDVPQPSFTASPQSSCTLPANVLFNPVIANSANLIYDWDFGDGVGTSTAESPSYTYTSFGDYNVSLTVTDTITGCTNTITETNFINIGNPVFFDFTPDGGCTDLTVSFMDLTTNNPSSWAWDFGDGVGTSNQQNPSYTYTAPGCYTVTLTATNAECTSTRVSDTCIEVNQSPSVSYTLDDPEFCDVPHVVNFQGSSDIGNSWFWNFGDGNTSNQQNPTHTYTGFGLFPVTLTVMTPDSCTASVTSDSVIITDFNVFINPSQDEGCAPLDVSFVTNTNSNSPVNTYTWDFGDPAIPASSDPNPMVIYADTGMFQVLLATMNDEGCTDTTTVNIEAGMQLTPVFSADTTIVCRADPIQFTDSTQGNVDMWLWDFGDGGSSGEPNPMYTYSDTGTFTVCLTVFNRGCANQTCIDDYITILPPIAQFGRLIDCNDPFTVTFEDQSIGATDWTWQFDTQNNPGLTSNDQNPTFVYSSTGTYIVTLEVFNDTTGCTDMISQVIEVREPMASFTVSPDSGCVPLVLNINNTSVDGATYFWTAPGADIANPTAFNPQITYNSGGIFSNITLQITDVNGCPDSFTYTNDIFVSQLIPAFDISDDEGCRPFTVTLTDQSTTFGGVLNSWFWDLGGGLTSNDQNPTLTINNVSVRDVSLTVSNSLGCTQTLIFEDTLASTFPRPEFEVDSLACPGQVLNFINTSAVAAPASYFWEFGDNTTSNDVHPSHSYINEGNYTVNLTVTDRNGCVDSTSLDILVAVPIADFAADTLNSSCPPQLVNFTDLSLNAFEWEWDFGDGSAPEFGQNAQHIYSEPGIYTVCLYVNNSTQCPDTICFQDYIQIDGPQGSFDTLSPPEGCVPLDVTFFGSGSNLVSYTWDNGGGDIQVVSSSAPTDSITFTYDQPGIYFPVLSVTDGPGCERSFSYPDPIIVHGVIADILSSDSILCGSSQVDFTSIIDTGIDTLQSLQWIFPGGVPGTSTDPNPSVSYDTLGTWDVILIADIGFCTDTIVFADYISVTEAPVPAFSWTPNEACNPGTIAFSDQTQLQNDFIAEYIWVFGTGDSAFVANPVYTFQDPGLFDVTFFAVTAGGCSVQLTQTITINPTPTAFAGEDLTICEGETVPLSGSGGDTYSWSPNIDLSCTNCQTTFASPTDTTDYVVTVFTNEGCFDRDTVRVNVRPFVVPQINLTRDTFICTDAFVQLFVEANVPGIVFQWDTTRLGLSCYTNCFNPFAAPDVTTTYVVSAPGNGGCVAMDSVTVVVLDEQMPFAGPDVTICEGEATQLSIGLGSDPVWTPSIGLSCTNCPDPFVSPPTSQEYVVEVSTPNGCRISDTVNVFVVTIDNVSAGEDQTICIGESIMLNAQGPGTITWDSDPDLSEIGIPNPIATPSTTNTYTANFEIDQCMISDSVTIFVRSQANISVADVSICEGDSAFLFVEGNASSFSWSPITGLSDPSAPDPMAFPAQTTTYTVIGGLGACTPDTATATVTVNEAPVIDLIPFVRFIIGQPFELNPDVDGAGGYQYNWSGGEDLSCTNCPNPVALPDSSVTYQLTVTDRNGCESTAFVEFRPSTGCLEENLVVPNAFSPNGDGLNDRLFVRSSLYQQINVFRVYDRWGTLVFETNSMDSGWDGTYKGKPLNTGVYVYYAEAPCPLDGSPVLIKGNVTLLR